MGHPLQIQIDFLRQVKEKLSAEVTLADEIAELLHVSMDSAYRRIRGETALTLEEAKILSLKYDISLDQLIRQSDNSITFKFSSINPNSYTFEDYYANILKSIQQIDGGKDKEIIYAAKDIPIFNLFQFPELAAFKIFFWMKTLMNFPGMENQKFSRSIVDEKIIQLGQRILQIYIRIPTTELWNEETVVSTLRQLEYSYESGSIKEKKDLELLYQKVESLIGHVQKQAEHGIKFIAGKEVAGKENNYRLFINEVLLSENNVHVKKDNLKITYVAHNAINFLTTSNKFFCEENEAWLSNLQRRSTMISAVAEKERNKFFRMISEKIEASKARML